MDDEEQHGGDELVRRRAERARDQDELSDEERERLRALHWMCCPKCGLALDEITFRDVKVDKCFSCGGVYLDDGELEQLAGKPGWFEAMRLYFSSSSSSR
ncbi:TFIIB-type zinc ribbon-containing protein [Paraliomyxa miuraensis]|uniref:TFIIB-type zinc ribbon-containing protein n=1 Tax=Paraliomyxa miuraensis TaxID=376150 RepID=UPI00224DE59C|nr:zf-TFIIB domain-containing protein [Paraliomyxa miuraensis]MCX4243294.1 zf-TFIIB domain-containing protein [Paraliomyxa miuraensis]